MSWTTNASRQVCKPGRSATFLNCLHPFDVGRPSLLGIAAYRQYMLCCRGSAMQGLNTVELLEEIWAQENVLGSSTRPFGWLQTCFRRVRGWASCYPSLIHPRSSAAEDSLRVSKTQQQHSGLPADPAPVNLQQQTARTLQTTALLRQSQPSSMPAFPVPVLPRLKLTGAASCGAECDGGPSRPCQVQTSLLPVSWYQAGCVSGHASTPCDRLQGAAYIGQPWPIKSRHVVRSGRPVAGANAQLSSSTAPHSASPLRCQLGGIPLAIQHAEVCQCTCHGWGCFADLPGPDLLFNAPLSTFQSHCHTRLF